MRNPNLTDRIAFAATEHRQELGLSMRELSEWSGVSRTTIAKMESGRPVRRDLALKVAFALTMLDAYRPPYFYFKNHVDSMLREGLWVAK